MRKLDWYILRKFLGSFVLTMVLILSIAIVFDISEKLEDQSYDFIFYDLQCKHMEGFHSSVIKKYLPKIKKGGVLIGCDFRSFRYDFYALGFKESDFKPCQFKNQRSQRLEYLHIN